MQLKEFKLNRIDYRNKKEGEKMNLYVQAYGDTVYSNINVYD